MSHFPENPYDRIQSLSAEVARLTAENERLSALADRWNAECDAMREDNKRLAAELATAKEWNERYAIELRELSRQEPVGEVDTYHKHVYLQVPWESLPNHSKVFSRPVPAAHAMKSLDADVAQMLADNAESLYVSSPAPQPPADHVPDAGKTIELLRDIETRYLADLLSHGIANLGYPVGCGIPPSDDHAMTAAGALFDRFVGIAAAMQKGAQ